MIGRQKKSSRRLLRGGAKADRSDRPLRKPVLRKPAENRHLLKRRSASVWSIDDQATQRRAATDRAQRERTEALRRSVILEPRAKAFLERIETSGVAPVYLLSYDEARELFSYLHEGLAPLRQALVVDTALPVGPIGSVDVRIVRPDSDPRTRPTVIYLHGGGWVAGGKQTHDWLIREIAVAADVTLFFVDYTLAPEMQYPHQNEQAYAVLSHVARYADTFRVDASRIAIIGDGAGGNMAAALTFMAKERNGPKIAFQGLFYPVLSDISENTSYERYADGPMLNLADMAYFFDAYFPSYESRREVTAFPLLASVENLRGLPETLLIVSEHDVLRDEGEQYAHKLYEAGVQVTSVRYNGTVHGFMTLKSLGDAPATRAAIAQIANSLRSAFYQ
ncbi:alpha/beta hydrolase [Caballeronia sp. LjRoot34]|uniref:alpha/beta hydrolase n=1 Tax=Caballeronia sp. LjRoot34 TaxID=3342325 RepID=UPI003ECFEBD3